MVDDGTGCGERVRATARNGDRAAGERVRESVPERYRRLADLAARIQFAEDVRAVITLVTEEARSLLDARHAVGSVIADSDGPRPLTVDASCDEIRAGGTPRRAEPGPSAGRRSPRIAPALDARPARGSEPQWLAMPLLGRGARTLGLLQLFGKVDAQFGEEDEALLAGLARIASAALENLADRERLRAADRRKDEFLATLAHELRNPLAPIRNGIEVIARSAGDPARIEPVCETLRRQASHMARLIDDLFNVSRITLGKLELRREPVLLAEIVDSALEATRPYVVQNNRRLHVEVAPEPIVLDADSTRLSQVVSNLLRNAATYTREGGQVWLHAGREDEEAVIRVRDDGMGIPADKLEAIFELFTQIGSSAEPTEERGLGIGLALVRSLVEMHGGRVEVWSDGPDRGSSFTVRLPLPVKGRAAHGDAASAQDGRPARASTSAMTRSISRTWTATEKRSTATDLACRPRRPRSSRSPASRSIPRARAT